MSKNGHKVRLGKLSEFRPQSANANKHTERGLRMLDDAMSEDGYVAPMTAVADSEIIDGSARLERAFDKFSDEAIILEHDGTRPIITVRTDIPNAKTKAAQRIAVRANRVAEADLDWDADILQAIDTDILEGLFSDKELNEILSQTGVEPKDAEPQIDKAEELRQKWGTETGQLWVIGNHRLLVGDATNKADVGRLLSGKRPLLVISDPPYGVDYDGGTTKRERIVGDKAPNLYAPFLELIRPLLDDRVGLYLFYADGDAAVTQAVTQAGFVVRNTLIWNKNQAQFGALSAQYKQKHEPFLYCHIKGKSPQWFGPTNEVTVWDCNRASSNNLHPTQKPVELFERALRNSSKSGDVILEGFAGSGTALVACENVGRAAYCLEIEAGYAAVCLERMTTAFPHLKIERVDKAVAA